LRYIPHTDEDIRLMLQKIGVTSIGELFEQIPAPLRFKGRLNLPDPMAEPALMAHLTELSGGRPAGGLRSFLGAGAYCHHLSPAVDQLLLRSEFYTAYTPYQPEVSQGTLQAIFEFQTMICRIFDMGIANASMYDGATAAAEAALMARRVTKRDRILVSAGLHPEYIEVIRTYLAGLDQGRPNMEIIPLDKNTGMTDLAALSKAIRDDACCVMIGYPNFFGVIDQLSEAAEMAQAAGLLTVSVTTDPFAFGLLAPPGALGADIAVGEGQPLGVPVSFGGPGLGLFTCRDDRRLMRQMPGRLCGQTVDTRGKTGYVLTLATREQHIRREKATSNICTNHGLCALAVAVNLSLLGQTGFEETARACLVRSSFVKEAVAKIDGYAIRYTGPTFNEFAVQCRNKTAGDVLDRLEAKGILGGVDLGRFDPAMDDCLLIAFTECHTRADIDALVAALREI
jgi:glycine dehydrogenase subunit 1